MSTPSAPHTTDAATATGATTADTSSTSEGTLANVQATETEGRPGFFARHTATLITLMLAVIVVAAAIAGLAVYKNNVERANSDTEAAFSATVAEQGASIETIECHGDTCAAVINGQAYTVLVQEDGKGKQHFGVSAYAGD